MGPSTGLLRRPPYLVAAALAIAIAAAATGCKGSLGENGSDFTVVNHTAQTITVTGRFQTPGQPVAPSAPSDPTLTLAPGQRDGVRFGLLAPGTCINAVFNAYDPAGKLIATDPSPICEDKHGNGATWTVETK